MALTSKQRRHLRSLAHHLEPLVQVGREGVTESLTSAVDQALLDHELIKVKLGKNLGLDKDQAASDLVGATGSEHAQTIGNVILLYRAHPDKPKIKL